MVVLEEVRDELRNALSGNCLPLSFALQCTKVSFPGISNRLYFYPNYTDIACCRAWIEASTKGAVLLFCAAEIENRGVDAGLSPGTAGLLGGMGGGIAQAYATMGFCTSEEWSSSEVMHADEIAMKP